LDDAKAATVDEAPVKQAADAAAIAGISHRKKERKNEKKFQPNEKISEKNEATTEEELLVNREKVQLRSTLLRTVEKQRQNCKKTRAASERASKPSKA
jgi:hypothetical protein